MTWRWCRLFRNSKSTQGKKFRIKNSQKKKSSLYWSSVEAFEKQLLNLTQGRKQKMTEEKGFLSDPILKSGKLLDRILFLSLRYFYHSEDISRIMSGVRKIILPGKKVYFSITDNKRKKDTFIIASFTLHFKMSLSAFQRKKILLLFFFPFFCVFWHPYFAQLTFYQTITISMYNFWTILEKKYFFIWSLSSAF